MEKRGAHDLTERVVKAPAGPRCEHKGAKDISTFDDREAGVRVINCPSCGIVEIPCSPS